MKSTRTGRILTLASAAVLLICAAGTNFAGSCSSSTANTASMKNDIVSTAAEAGTFTTLIAAVQAAGLEDALRGEGPLTVFAPTDAAFAKLPKGTLETLLKPENKEMLTAILTYHVSAGSLTADRVVKLDRVDTLNGQSPEVIVKRGSVMLDDATVTATDIMASNGVIHVIDSVLLPEAPADTRAANGNEAARQLIGMAIDRGVPLFNDGQTEACVAVYEIAAQGLIASNGFDLDRDDRRTLEAALDRAGDTHDARRGAWIMRDALDNVMSSLRHDGGAMMMSRR